MEMARELKHIDITDRDELLKIVEEAQRARQPLVLTMGTEDVAILRPVKPRDRRAPAGKVLTREDPLFNLIGIGQSNVPGGVSAKKHEYLLDAYRRQHSK